MQKQIKFTVSVGLYGHLAERVQRFIELQKERHGNFLYVPCISRHGVVRFLVEKGLDAVEKELGNS